MQQNNEAAGAVKVTDDVKTHIIDLVKRKDILWKVKSRGYKLDAEKAAAYLEISNQVNELHSLSLKGEDIQNIFKNLKDSYMRRLKSAKKAMGNTGDGAKSKKREDKFIFADELEFLLENESDLDVSRRVLGMGSQDLYSRADEELASVLRTLAEENKKNKYEHFADEVACCLKTVEDRNPTLALDMKRQIQEYETSTKADHLAASRQSTSSSQERPKDEGIRPILALGASAITLQFLRFSRADFDSLHETLRANLEKPRNRRYPISSKHRLAVFLRFIGHGPSFKAMETSFGISEAGIFRIALPPWMENTLERRHQTEEVPCSSITRTFSNYWMDMLMPELLNLCGN
ncbi:hypothetical protein QR680_013101 [Steinernema hermaphroditum]|uniref:MADF domain-containing protein n=1 Tax=Steinernema hermaphroditum TaxID=289476 RepID=A0AA39I4C8_9BILA|nr:hypothetical protein QR680_013101 [Steinernema hermaphroditum]